MSGATTKSVIATISMASASVLICGCLRGEKDNIRAFNVDEMTGVVDACLAKGLTFTLVADPLFDANEDYNSSTPTVYDNSENRLRRGIKYWLHQGYHYFFYTSHGAYMDWGDGVYRSSVDFYDPEGEGTFPVIGNNYWVDPARRFVYPAFSDLGINPNQYRIVQINACWSGGSWVKGTDPTIAQAFGNYGAVDNDQVYIGWLTKYYPLGSPWYLGLQACGTAWTREFWYYLGRGYNVNQAIYYADNSINYNGWMHNFLYAYGGTYVTWLTY